MRKLGIIAGTGALPRRIADSYDPTGAAAFFIAFEGITDPDSVRDRTHAWVKLGQMQATMDRMLEAGVEDVVMAGPIKRPALSSLDLDARATKMLFRAGARAFGDDGLLSLLVSEIEKDGLTVLGIDQVLGELLAPSGSIAGPEADPVALADVERGITVLTAMGAVDVGQSAAVQEGLVLAVEAVEGTDDMIARAGQLIRQGPAPVLVKISKPGQERRADLPTIGPDTVSNALAAGFRGLALEAGGTLLIDGDEVRRVATAAGFFVLGVSVPSRP